MAVCGIYARSTVGFQRLTRTTGQWLMSPPDPADEFRRLYPPILTTAHVAEMMHCTIGDVRDKVHRKETESIFDFSSPGDHVSTRLPG